MQIQYKCCFFKSMAAQERAEPSMQQSSRPTRNETPDFENWMQSAPLFHQREQGVPVLPAWKESAISLLDTAFKFGNPLEGSTQPMPGHWHLEAP